MQPETVFAGLLKQQKQSRQKPPETFQGVSKARIAYVLGAMGVNATEDIVDVVFALLDDTIPSLFKKASGFRFAAGATTAQIGAHVGVYQRRGTRRLDREGRDYWIKPLRAFGAIEPVTLSNGEFVAGHPVSKSSNSAYRLAAEFTSLLRSTEIALGGQLKSWIDGREERQRGAIRAEAAVADAISDPSSHVGLIRVARDVYAVRFLPDYQVIYVDSGDGDRVSEKQKGALDRAGIQLGLGDAYPDILLWNPTTDRLWVIEAVTSDGEVDEAKVDAVTRLMLRSGKRGVNFTTVYATWRAAARRQGPHHNLALHTYLWIAEDPARALLVTTFDPMWAIESLPLRDQ